MVGDRELAEAPRLLLERRVRVDDLLGPAMLVQLVDSVDTDADHRVRLLGRDPARPPEVDPGLAAPDDSVLVLGVEDREAEPVAVPGRARLDVARRDDRYGRDELGAQVKNDGGSSMTPSATSAIT